MWLSTHKLAKITLELTVFLYELSVNVYYSKLLIMGIVVPKRLVYQFNSLTIQY